MRPRLATTMGWMASCMCVESVVLFTIVCRRGVLSARRPLVFSAACSLHGSTKDKPHLSVQLVVLLREIRRLHRLRAPHPSAPSLSKKAEGRRKKLKNLGARRKAQGARRKKQSARSKHQEASSSIIKEQEVPAPRRCLW
jgi:hypothetical protein